MEPINITEFRLLWWDLSDLTESKVSSWMNIAFRCSQCRGDVTPPHEEVEFHCSCGAVTKVHVVALAGNSLFCSGCKQPITMKAPQLATALAEELACKVCGATKQTYKDPAENWKVSDYLAAIQLYHVSGAWRNKWFNYTLNDFVFYDQRSVRVVPVQHSQDVENLIECAKNELITEVLPLDTLGIFAKWHSNAANVDLLWGDVIKFPKFIASDNEAKKAVLDTVKGSILGFIREANEKVLVKINETGKVHKRTAASLLKKLEELRERDVWQVCQKPEVQQEMEALEGLLQAQIEEEA